MSERTIENALNEAKELAQNEYAHIQIQGRALTSEEMKRSDTLSKCIEIIQSALGSLAEGN